MKWFWRINYLLTIYFIVSVIVLCCAFSVPINSHWLERFVEYFTLGESVWLPSLYIEWLQFPLCLLVLFAYKNQRTAGHYAYTALLPILSLIKWVLYILMAMEFTGGAGH